VRPLAGLLSSSLAGGALGGIGSWLSAGSAAVLHDGGIAGSGGHRRQVPLSLFAGAARFHGGGWPGLRSDEVPAILQRGERVQSREEVRRNGGEQAVSVVIHAKDAQSFRQSRVQVARDIARAVAFGRRAF